MLYRDGQTLYASYDGKVVYKDTPSSEAKAKALFTSMTSVPFKPETARIQGAAQQLKTAVV